MKKISIEGIEKARERLRKIVVHTPLMYNETLSQRYACKVWLKREDLQYGRSYKIRGAGNFLRATPQEELSKGVVAASAGNHAQGVAIGCTQLGIKGTIFMPKTTPQQKIKKVRNYGQDNIDIRLEGDTFDDAFAAAKLFCDQRGYTFVHPFNHPLIIEGQGTIAVELLEDAAESIDFVFCAVGGGGMSSGVSTYFKTISPYTKIIGVEPAGAPSLTAALKAGEPVQLDKIDKFIDGAAVGKMGDITFAILKELMHDVVLVPEGMACTTILNLYNDDAVVVEPAGALPVSALEAYKDSIRGKNVVCVIGGSNNDIERMAEIRERSLLYEGLLHYFVFYLPSRAGALAEFLYNVITPKIDVVKIEHEKRSSKETGATVMGLNTSSKEQYRELLERLDKANIDFVQLDKNPEFNYYFP